MFKHDQLKAFVVTFALLGYAGASMAEDYGDTVVRRHAYEKAAVDRVSSIPANQKLTKVDALGHRKIALYTADSAGLNVWLVTTDKGCEQPKLFGSSIVSIEADGKTQPCSVERIQPVAQGTLMFAMWSSSSFDLISPDGFAGSDRGAYQIAATTHGRP